MPLPSPPWTLVGHAVQTLQTVALAAARALLPPELRTVPVAPGRTLASLYLARYGPGSTLAYHELMIALLARSGLRPGVWIPVILVDDPQSRAGGRAHWGLPKELARFDWQSSGIGAPGRVAVRFGDALVCELHHDAPRPLTRPPLARVPLPVPGFGRSDGRLIRFGGRASARVGHARAQLEVPDGSPLAPLGLAGPVRSYHHDDLRLRVDAARPLRGSERVEAASPAPAGAEPG